MQETTKEYNKRYFQEKTKPNRVVTRRNRTGIKDLVKVTALIEEDLCILLKKAMEKTNNKNMSKYIEDNIKISKNIGKRVRMYGNKYIKKTFSFSSDLVEKLKKGKTISLTINEGLENMLKG